MRSHRPWRRSFFSRMTVALCGLATLLIAGACRRSDINAKPPVPVRVSTVEQIEDGNTVRYSATIVPTAQVDLSFKSNGYVSSIRLVRGADGNRRKLDEGDWVEKGTVLAVVDQKDYLDRVAQAKAQLDRAEAEFERAKLQFGRTSTLYEAKSATKPEYDRDKAQFESTTASVSAAQAQVSEAQIALEYCSLRAPFEGWIVKRNIDLGSLVGAATVGFTVSNTQKVKAVFGVPDIAISRVQLGQRHAITTDALTGSFDGRVTSISPAADPKSRVYSVEITIPNPQNKLKAGMIATIMVAGQVKPEELLAVPLESVIRDPQRPTGFAVLLVEGSGDTLVAQERPVELGDPYGNSVTITKGLTRGERVITRGATLIKSGDHVRVIP